MNDVVSLRHKVGCVVSSEYRQICAEKGLHYQINVKNCQFVV